MCVSGEAEYYLDILGSLYYEAAFGLTTWDRIAHWCQKLVLQHLAKKTLSNNLVNVLAFSLLDWAQVFTGVNIGDFGACDRFKCFAAFQGE